MWSRLRSEGQLRRDPRADGALLGRPRRCPLLRRRADSPARDPLRRCTWCRHRGVDEAIQVATSFDGACAVSASGAVSCWTHRDQVPSVVEGLPPVVEVALRSDFDSHACARTLFGTAVDCWGATNEEGEFGDLGEPSPMPVKVADF